MLGGAFPSPSLEARWAAVHNLNALASDLTSKSDPAE
jgi:hypothetical protein